MTKLAAVLVPCSPGLAKLNVHIKSEFSILDLTEYACGRAHVSFVDTPSCAAFVDGATAIAAIASTDFELHQMLSSTGCSGMCDVDR